jgi:hypothetical protein
MLKLFSNFYSPDDTPGTSAPMGKDDIIKFLGDDDEKAEVIPIKETKEKVVEETTEKDIKEDETEEVDELKELEDELEEPDDEKLELTTPVRRGEILKKYPQLFKDFPYLEKAYYREQQYTEILPTINDAKEAVNKASILDNVDDDINNGDLEKILLATKEGKGYNKLIDNYLPLLAKIDEKAYHHVIGNTIKHTIIAMVRESRRSNNEALQASAQILNQFVFGSSEFEDPKQLSTDITKVNTTREDEFEQKKKDFTQQKFNSANDDLNTRVNNVFKATIDANIDPKDSMSEYVKRNAVRESLESLESLISQDKRFSILVDKLWENASQNDFNKESLDKIRSAFTSKAKTLLPSVIKKARNDALKGMGKRVEEDKAERPTFSSSSTKHDQPRSKEALASKDGKGLTKGMSSLDFLMQD